LKLQAVEESLNLLKKELAETKAELIADQRLPEIHELFRIPAEYFTALEIEKNLPKELIQSLPGADILELACGAGERAQVLRKYLLKSYLGLDASETLIKFATNNTPDSRLTFRTLHPNSFEKLSSQRFSLVLYMPSKKSFAILEFEKTLEFALNALGKGGKLFLTLPYPISDLTALGFDLLKCLEMSGYETRIENSVIIAVLKEASNVAVS